MLGKTLLNLDQVGRDAGAGLRRQPRRCASEAPQLMQQRMRQSVSASNVFAAALETKEFVEQLAGARQPAARRGRATTS